MYRYVTLYQNVNTCSYCNVCITHIFCKASLIPLKHDNICFIKNCSANQKPVRTLSIFTSMAFVKDANGISFKNRLKGHINLRKVRNFIII